jgi:hypothetical protein
MVLGDFPHANRANGVARHTFQRIDAIFLSTVGTGTGANARINEAVGQLFRYTHERARTEMQREALGR